MLDEHLNETALINADGCFFDLLLILRIPENQFKPFLLLLHYRFWPGSLRPLTGAGGMNRIVVGIQLPGPNVIIIDSLDDSC